MHLEWRRVLVQHIHGRYFKGNTAYWLNVVDGRIDNADQRLSQDVEQVSGGV